MLSLGATAVCTLLVAQNALAQTSTMGGQQEAWTRRAVALKLPRVSWLAAPLRQRLEREREILATLAHPNVCRTQSTTALYAPSAQITASREGIQGKLWRFARNGVPSSSPVAVSERSR